VKLATLITVLFVTVNGCASRHTPSPASASAIPDAKQEIQALQAEIDLLVRSLAKLQRELAAKRSFGDTDQKRTLERQIVILRQARHRLSVEEKSLREKYHLWDIW
jgi:hypothetical protein